MPDLSNRHCVPCRGGVPPLSGSDVRELTEGLKEWEVVNEHHLRKTYQFEDFRSARLFVQNVSEVAEEEGHHPRICFTWGSAEITIWTHKVDGLTESDFILAAKIDALK